MQAPDSYYTQIKMFNHRKRIKSKLFYFIFFVVNFVFLLKQITFPHQDHLHLVISPTCLPLGCGHMKLAFHSLGHLNEKGPDQERIHLIFLFFCSLTYSDFSSSGYLTQKEGQLCHSGVKLCYS